MASYFVILINLECSKTLVNAEATMDHLTLDDVDIVYFVQFKLSRVYYSFASEEQGLQPGC